MTCVKHINYIVAFWKSAFVFVEDTPYINKDGDNNPLLSVTPFCVSLDSVCIISRSSPEEQISHGLWHHQHADGLWQSWAQNEGLSAALMWLWCLCCMWSRHLTKFSFQELMESLDSLLCGDGSESLKSLCLKLLLCLVTVRFITTH